MKQSKIRFFIFTIFSICFAVGFLWVIIDSIMVWRGFKPLDLSYGFETEFLEGRGYAMRRGTQNYRTFINSLGMRREELPELVPGEKRILTLGDSTCYSSNASFENSWPNVLERDLRSKGNKITVMNGGVPGYSTMNMYHAFKWYLKRTKIDYVIIHGGWNNYWNDKALVENFDPDSYLKKIFPNSPDLEDVNKNLTVIENIDSSSNLLEHSSGAMKYIATSSALGHYLVKNIWLTIIDPMLRGSISQGSKVNSVDNKKSITSVNPELAIDDYMLYLGLLIKEARKNNITPIIIKPFSVLRIPGFNALKASKEYPLYMAKDYTWMIPRMKEMDKASEVFSKYNLAYYIDPTSDLLKEINLENVFHKDVNISYMGSPSHPFDRGNILLSKILAEKLSEQKILEPAGNVKWVHPKEKQYLYDLKFREVNFKVGKKGLLFVALFSLFLVISGISIMSFLNQKLSTIQLAISPFISYLVLVSTQYILFQFSEKILINFSFSCFIFIIMIIFSYRKKIREDIIRIISPKVGLSIFLSVLSICFFSLYGFEKLNSITCSTLYNGCRLIQEDLALTDFLFDKDKDSFRLYSLYTLLQSGEDRPKLLIDIMYNYSMLKQMLPLLEGPLYYFSNMNLETINLFFIFLPIALVSNLVFQILFFERLTFLAKTFAFVFIFTLFNNLPLLFTNISKVWFLGTIGILITSFVSSEKIYRSFFLYYQLV